MNPQQHNTADEVLTELADPLDALLRQIINGFFVLTDGQGAVSKWSEPAELLFGQPGEDILGHGFFETLIGGDLPSEAQAWRAFLDAGEPPRVPGSVRVVGRRSDGETFPLEAVFVPVKLDEGFDFSLFLEDLSFELPLNLMLLRMRQQHPVVVRALKSALEPVAQPWEGWRTAGTLVVFKPLAATPWVESELARREAERALADAEAEERLTNTDPGIQGGLNDLDDAAAVVARLLSAMERIDELERVAGGLPAQLEETRRESARDAETLRGDVQRALAGVPSELDRHEAERRLARLERADEDVLAAAEAAAARVSARLDGLERDGAAADARLAAEIAAAEARAAEALSRLDGGSDVAAQLEEVRAEHEEAAHAIRSELAATVERLERDRQQERSAARAELAGALERVEQVQRGADALREQLRAAAGDDRVDALAASTEALRARVADLATTDQLAELRHSLGVDLTALRDAVARHDGALQAAALSDLDALREAVARHEGAAAEIAALREAVGRHDAAASDLRDALARREAAAGDVDALREAVARHDGDLVALRESVAPIATDLAALRESTADLPALRDTVRGFDALRAAVARHEAAAGDVTALRDAVAMHAAATADLAARAGDPEALRQLDERQAAAAAEVAALREAVQRQDSAAADVAARQDGLAAELERLRAQLGAAAGAAPEQAAVESRVQTLVGDTQRELSELHGRLGDHGHELGALRARVDDLAERTGAIDFLATADDVAALREHIDALPGRDELAGLVTRQELDAVARHEDIAGLAGRDEVAALRESLDSMVAARIDGLAPREQIDALRDRLDGLAERHELAALRERLDGGAEELRALRERLEAGAGTEEVAALRDRLDGLVRRDELGALARHEDLATLAGRDELDAVRERLEETAERISQVDRGAGTVLADVRAMRGQVEAAETEALGARQAAVAAGEAANAAQQNAARAAEDVAAARRDVEAQEARTALLTEHVTGARSDASAARAATEGLDQRLAAIDQRAAALRDELGTVGGQVDRLGGTVVETGVALKGEIGEVRDGLDALRAELAVMREEAKRGDDRVEALQSELTYALSSLDELKQGLSSAGQAAVIARREAEQARKAAQHDGSTERVTEVFQQILGLAAQRNAQSRRPQPAAPGLSAPPAEPAAREPRHGFDDEPAPMAILALDGKFKELNPAFTKLVGYKEHEFMKAAWPSPHDRKDYKGQIEQLRRLGAGELRAVDVASTYMHGQGLMVPVVGTLTLATGDDGAPSHLVLEAEERATA